MLLASIANTTTPSLAQKATMQAPIMLALISIACCLRSQEFLKFGVLSKLAQPG